MKYAIVNGVRTEPKKGLLLGTCACCGTQTVAKCGNFKIHHWAHKSKAECDPWWENESEWHRSWKNYFPTEWQEVIFQSPQTGEKHIADIFTGQYVIEIQSYSIPEDEARKREIFYGNMIWVINGCRSDFDKVYFNMSLCGPHPNDPYLRNIKWCGKSKLLAKWGLSTKPVYFDFGTDLVWALLSYDPKTKFGQVKAYPKDEMIRSFGGVFP